MRELRWTEEKIWKTTPRKFFALLECAKEFSEGEKKDSSDPKSGSGTKKVKDGYIDQINW